jgi:hypothetical protein
MPTYQIGLVVWLARTYVQFHFLETDTKLALFRGSVAQKRDIKA